MNAVISVLRFVVFLYILAPTGRLAPDWTRPPATEWKPRGGSLDAAEAIYTLTEPPLRALRRVIPPLRLGGATIDLSFMVLFFAVYLLYILLGVL